MENINLTISLSQRFRNILQFMNNDVSRFILNLEDNYDYSYPISYIDISDTNDQLTFIQSNKFKEIVKDYDNSNDEVWISKKRMSIRIGRLIGLLAPFFSNQDIENFVNLYKSEFKRNDNIKFKIVEGDDIVKYYNEKYYHPGRGSLNKSCMRHDSCSRYMDIYKNNPEKIKLLILIDEHDNKILGRSLIWKMDEPVGKILMDRIYTIDGSNQFLFKKYADLNKWIYKTRQTFDCTKFVVDGEELFLQSKIYINGYFDFFPYIDTLIYYNEQEKYLTNSVQDYKNCYNVIKLREINGNHSGNENFVYDIFNKKIIKLDDSIYCYYGDGYTHKDDAFYLDEFKEYAVPNQLIYSTYLKKFLLKEKSIYFEKLSSYLSIDEVRRVYISIKDFDYFLKDDENKIYIKSFEDGRYYIMDLLIKSPVDGKYYIKDKYDEEKLKNKLKERKKIELKTNKQYSIDSVNYTDERKKWDILTTTLTQEIGTTTTSTQYVATTYDNNNTNTW